MADVKMTQLNEALRLYNGGDAADQPYKDLLNVLNKEFEMKGELTNGNEVLNKIFKN